MTLSFDPTAGLIVVPVRLTGPAGDCVAHLALDTGATRTLVNWSVAVLLGFDPAAAEERFQIVTGSGVEYSPQVTVDSIEALDVRLERFNVLCHTLPPGTTVDGVLGLDFLRDGRLIIDMAKVLVSLA